MAGTHRPPPWFHLLFLFPQFLSSHSPIHWLPLATIHFTPRPHSRLSPKCEIVVQSTVDAIPHFRQVQAGPCPPRWALGRPENQLSGSKRLGGPSPGSIPDKQGPLQPLLRVVPFKGLCKHDGNTDQF